VAQLRATPTAGLKVVGFVDPALPQGTQVDSLSVLGDLGRLGRLVQRLGVEELIVIPTAMEREELLDIYRDWGTDKRVHIRLSSGLYELCTTGAQVSEVGFIPMMSLNRTRITGVDALMKAALDFVGALVSVVLLAPVFLIIGALVRRDSSGPVIYRRRVVGLYGRNFDAYKFRTMIPNAEAYLEAHPELMEQWEQDGKIQDDPRITRVGRLLRRYSLDELPQLFNVLKGQMSLVGPRMITPAELSHFGRWRHNLMTVKPGLTGLWQVSGRSDLSYEDRVRLDMQYIRNYTIWTDLRLVFNTVWTVLKGRGAY
jgi:exopolysaccharide biosynthesis polyprenyl glycosylphosphotransferase